MGVNWYAKREMRNAALDPFDPFDKLRAGKLRAGKLRLCREPEARDSLALSFAQKAIFW